MKLITEFCIYRSWEDSDKDAKAERLLDEIKALAELSPCGFWTEDGEKHCVVVRGFLEDLSNAVYIKRSEIEREVREWCNDLKDWCNDDADSGPEDKLLYKQLTVEMEDLDYEGGLHVKCFDKDGEPDHELFILPMKGRR